MGILAILTEIQPTVTEMPDSSVAPFGPPLVNLTVQHTLQLRHMLTLSTLLLGQMITTNLTKPILKVNFAGGAGSVKDDWDSILASVRTPLNISSLEAIDTGGSFMPLDPAPAIQALEDEQQLLLEMVMDIEQRIQRLHILQQTFAAPPGDHIIRTNKKIAKPSMFHPRPAVTANAVHTIVAILCICGLLGAGVLLYLIVNIKRGKGTATLYAVLLQNS